MKWFSFHPESQLVKEITPSEIVFSDSSLLFWKRGLDEWVNGVIALEIYLKPPQIKDEDSTGNIENKETLDLKESTQTLPFSYSEEEIEVLPLLKNLYPKRKVPRNKITKKKYTKNLAAQRAFKAAYSLSKKKIKKT